MPVLRINRRALANLPPVLKPTIFYDDDLKGFGVRVMPSGSRAWIVEYRPGSGSRDVAKKRLTIGSTFTLSPEDARREARKLLACVELGEDPAGARAAVRKAETVRDLITIYMDQKSAPRRSLALPRPSIR